MELKAVYQSPDASKTFSSTLPSLPNGSEGQNVKEKTAYLSDLRSGITQMQSGVNVFLTEKMEQDKSAQTNQSNAKKAKEEKEEEMYGEEDPEGDD